LADSSDHRTEAFALVQRAIRLQLSDDAELSEVEVCLLKAVELDATSIEALQEAAHFYDAVLPDEAKATEFALRCRAQAANVSAEMDEILSPEQEARGRS
jgi:hypothetical protein